MVGAGLAGLACARACVDRGASVIVLEAGSEAGGRVRSDYVAGFVLDRGFQVLLTAYPEARRALDYDALRLHAFFPGALVRRPDGFVRVADPFRRPLSAMRGALSPIGTLADKVRVLALRSDALAGLTEQRHDVTALELLQEYGFTEAMTEQFFRPFLGGVFLDRSLRTRASQLGFVWHMFARGDTSLPAGGMRAIAQQLHDALPPGTVLFRREVARVSGHAVHLPDGERIDADAVVLATGARAAAALRPDLPAVEGRAATCLYFAAPESPLLEPILALDGEGRGPVNNLCVPSDVAPGYAPLNQSLISTTVPGDPDLTDDDLERAVREQMRDWFGAQVRSWQHLRTYRIRHAVPAWEPGTPDIPLRTDDGVWLAGDYTENPSLHGALRSGRRVAEALFGESAGQQR